MQNQFIHTAHLYDYDNKSVLEEDLPFYLSYAGNASGLILELACGTGRLTLPIARAGHPIHGLDLSPQMLREFEKKLADEAPLVRSNVRFFHADMASFELPHRYALIFVAYRSFQSLTESRDQESCLASVREHLAPGGKFIINVFKPQGRLDERWINLNEAIDFDQTIGQKRVRRTNVRRAIDPERQIIYPEFTYYVEEAGKPVQKLGEKLKLKYYYEPQLRQLLVDNQFEILESYGSYQRTPAGEGNELIFVCRNTSNGS